MAIEPNVALPIVVRGIYVEPNMLVGQPKRIDIADILEKRENSLLDARILERTFDVCLKTLERKIACASREEDKKLLVTDMMDLRMITTLMGSITYKMQSVQRTLLGRALGRVMEREDLTHVRGVAFIEPGYVSATRTAQKDR